MSKGVELLSSAKVKRATKPGRYGDGGGLSLRVRKNGHRGWVFRWHVRIEGDDGKIKSVSRDVGLGSVDKIGLSAARKLAQRCREAVALGQDPAKVIRPPKVTTFLDVAKDVLGNVGLDQMAPASRRQWERTALETFKPLHRRPIATVTTDDVVAVLKPHWTATPETARRDRMRLERIMGHAIARELHEGPNPARWKNHLDTLMDKHSAKDKSHHWALPYTDAPSFASWLKTREPLSARLAEFLLYTALRTTEARLLRWDEVNLADALAIIPKDRMKNRKPFTVPLEGRALEIIMELNETRIGPLVFPGRRPDKPMSLNTALKQAKRFDDRMTMHGLRSAFRDFSGDRTQAQRETAEAALSHRLGSSEEIAYRRGDALAKRRALMRIWADYLSGAHSADVVTLQSRQEGSQN